MRNVLRLKQIAEIIQVDPTRWNQDHFTEDSDTMTFHYKFDWDGEVEGVCGTSQCIAGWAVAIDDQELFINLSNDDVEDGEEWDWTAQARRILGLGRAEAQFLFWQTVGALVNPDHASAILYMFAAGCSLETIEAAFAEMISQ